MTIKEGRDLLDVAAEQTQIMTDSAVYEVQKKAQTIEVGFAAMCDYCDEPSARVVMRNVYVGKPAMLLCARCRDELRVG